MGDVDWSNMLTPSGSLLEIVIRGSVVYLLLFLAMRFLPRRTIGGVGPSDLLIVVLIADAVQEAMAGKYESITEGLVLAATILFWAVFIDFLDYRFPKLHISDGKQIALVRDGRLIERNMRRQNITADEIMAQMRHHGLSSLRNVEAVYVEGDGQFSVLLRGGMPLQPPPHQHVG
jgi:uncharacterized membrane protein YcaP (DUF421 family)